MKKENSKDGSRFEILMNISKKSSRFNRKKKVEIIKKLIEIFEIEKDEKEIQESIYILSYEDQRKKDLERWNQKESTVQKIISEYHQGYRDLIIKIEENKENMPFMKTATQEIVKNYFQLFKLDYVSFFYRFYSEVPLMIYAVLMHQKLRSFFLERHSIRNEIKQLDYLQENETLFDSFKEYKTASQDEKQMIKEKTQKKIGWKYFNGNTEGYWKDLEEKGTKVMALSILHGYIAEPDNRKKEFSVNDVNDNFLILDGLLYKNTKKGDIDYMVI